MKKFYFVNLLLVFLAFAAFGQEWIVYDGSVLPDLVGFSTSNTGGDQYTNTILDDPDNEGNKLLELISPQEDPGKFMWKYTLTNDVNDPFTIILRVKGTSDTLDRTMEIDIQQAGFRERLYLKNDNTFELKEGGVKEDLPGSPLDWHIIRISKNADAVSFYMDENPVAVASVTTATTSSENYFRFGDGNGSSTLGALVDWVAWDTTGAYAPEEGVALPDSLSQEVPSWVIYAADVTPDNDNIDFGTSNVAGTDLHSNTIVADPDNDGNNLLKLISPEPDPGKFMWKHNLPNDVDDALTMVARIKSENDTMDRTMEFDIQQAGFRERLYLKNDDSYQLKEANVSGDLPIDLSGWHIIRITKDADQVAVYIDEADTAFIEVTTATTSSENYFRFGDGNGSSTLGGIIDWMVWDTTGAYAPNRGTFLPSTLVTDIDPWPVGISATSGQPLARIYPNPAEDLLMVEYQSAGKADISLFDMVGKLIMQRTLNTSNSNIDISDLHSGVYLIQINAEGKTDIQRFIKR